MEQDSLKSKFSAENSILVLMAHSLAGLWVWSLVRELRSHMLSGCNQKINKDFGASLVAQMVKNSPAVQETQVRFLGRENPMEKGMATHSGILAWRIPWISGRLKSLGSQRVGHDWVTNTVKHWRKGTFYPYTKLSKLRRNIHSVLKFIHLTSIHWKFVHQWFC